MGQILFTVICFLLKGLYSRAWAVHSLPAVSASATAHTGILPALRIYYLLITMRPRTDHLLSPLRIYPCNPGRRTAHFFFHTRTSHDAYLIPRGAWMREEVRSRTLYARPCSDRDVCTMGSCRWAGPSQRFHARNVELPIRIVSIKSSL